MATSNPEHVPAHSTFHTEVMAQWARQARAYARSVRLYRQLVARNGERQAGRANRIGRPQLAVADGPAVRAAGGAESSRPASALLDHLSPHPTRAGQLQPPVTGPLTRRQLEIATLIARGLTNEQIADELVLTRGTVGNHIGQMLRRLGAKNRAQIAAWVIRHAADG